MHDDLGIQSVHCMGQEVVDRVKYRCSVGNDSCISNAVVLVPLFAGCETRLLAIHSAGAGETSGENRRNCGSRAQRSGMLHKRIMFVMYPSGSNMMKSIPCGSQTLELRPKDYLPRVLVVVCESFVIL